jgi:hypothetical protein
MMMQFRQIAGQFEKLALPEDQAHPDPQMLSAHLETLFSSVSRSIVASRNSMMTLAKQVERTTPNQAMQRAAGRFAFPLSMTPTFNWQRRAPSPAVADLVSR